MLQLFSFFSFFVFIALSAAPLRAQEHHHMEGMSMPAEPVVKAALWMIEARSLSPMVLKQKAEILLTLKDNEGKPVTLDRLEEVHTQRFHLFLLDPSFNDFQHVHPTPTENPGEYRFSFTPTRSTYRLWADVKDSAGQHYVTAFLNNKAAQPTSWAKEETRYADEDGLRFAFKTDGDLRAGQETTAHISIYDVESGAPFTQLEPILGAYAHVIGVMNDYATLVHMHPMGDEPKKDTDRGGPYLSFHIQPTKPGFMRLFAQFTIYGQWVTVPFTLRVKP